MKIAILVAGLPPERVGGAERQAAQMAGHLAARHTIRIFTRTRTVPRELTGCERCTVTTRTSVDVRGLRFPADVAATLSVLRRQRRDIDVVVAYQTVIDGLIAVLARAAFGIPAVVMVRCDTEYQLDRFVQSRIFSPFVFRHADRLAVQSSILGDELVQVFERRGGRPTAAELRAKLFVVPNGIAPIAPRDADGEGVLYVGRLTRLKAVDVLIEAMRELPDEHLTIVGDGEERPALERAARGLTNVSFVGRVDHARVADFLKRARVLVQPSRQEGQPNIVMEAMACGLPVVATRVGGVPDLIAHGESGWLTEPGDASGIARGIREIARDPQLRARFAENGAREMRRYQWPAIVEQFERTLADVVSARR